MNIIWCGGEDVDFPNGNSPVVGTTANRAGWARSTVAANNSQILRSTVFRAGAVTSAWFSCRFNWSAGPPQAQFLLGVGKSGSSNGLGLGCTASAVTQAGLFKYNGTTHTQLAVEVGNSLTTNALHRMDMQILNFGASATVIVYIDGAAAAINFTGDTTLSGFTNFDSVFVNGPPSGVKPPSSEFIVSDTDTRSLSGLVTLALTGAGTTNAWTNPTFSNINGTTLSDTNPTNSNTAAQDNQYNVTDLPAGTYNVQAVKQTIRAAVSSTPTATQIKMGYLTSGSIVFGAGAAKTPATVYGTIEQYDAINPLSGVKWAQTDINPLQLDFQSA